MQELEALALGMHLLVGGVGAVGHIAVEQLGRIGLRLRISPETAAC